MVPVLFPFLGAAVDGVLRVDSAVLAWRPLGSRKELLCGSSQGRPEPSEVLRGGSCRGGVLCLKVLGTPVLFAASTRAR